ncbi:MAG TPA: SDR family NAD(P)-dependent oxidoreductase [Mycobacterium sp.]|nr:SDR family NAD(P)-dependent oxidoreductase [Mycobacterium sp.]HTX95021.1 SDR family NAD(P)-dependent oxidoreductase [Mycobacterium sp.]
MKTDPIAIVGMACRYPDANSPVELWQNVLARRRAFRRIPACRLSASYLGPPDDSDRAYVTHAAVLRDWEFDREAFGVPGPLHRTVDHTHWLALQTAADALADAGHAGGEGLARHHVGVVFGNTLTGEFGRASSVRLRWPFIADAAARALAKTGVPTADATQVLAHMEQLIKQPFPQPGDDTLAGALSNTIAGRICNHFDFHGTGFTVDGACSSSLIAVMMACRALTAGELDFALAGAVDLSLDPFELVGFSRLGALAKDDMRVYDAQPTGFLPGEGCGVIALTRADDAARLGMRTYGHIVGWASSSDGSGGLTRPTVAGQALAIRRACRMAMLPPCALGLIEGHGTGTAVGDQIELQALTEVREHASERAALGTIKANIGHTKAAAGMAGLIKATLAAFHHVLPPTTGCVDPHQLLLAEDAPLRVLAEPEMWCDPTPRAGVSSMGFGGINVHVVVEGPTSSPPAALPAPVRRWSTRCGRCEIVIIDGASPALLAERLSDIANAARALSHAELRDIAVTEWQQIASGPKEFRAAIVAACPEQLAATAEIAASVAGRWDVMLRVDRHRGYALGTTGSPRIGLLFPGQAAPARATLSWWADKCQLPQFTSNPAAAMETVCTDYAQPAIIRQSLAGIAWLRTLSVVPVAAVGHSVGEISALCWAGALSAEAALDLAAQRGRIMSVHGDRDSTMASLSADAQTVSTLLCGSSVAIACYNAPDVTTVTGTREEIKHVTARAAEIGVHAVEINVSHGFHGPAMSAAREPLRQLLADFPINSPQRPVISTITGRELPQSASELRDLLVQQLTSPVQYRPALNELVRRCDLLVETGPGTILSNLAEANHVGVPVVSLDCGGDDQHHALATAALAVTSADLEAWFADRPYRTLSVTDEPRFLVNPCEDRTTWTDTSESIVLTPISEPSESSTASALGSSDPLAALVAHLSDTLELPAHSITSSSGFLTDLHLSSLQAVQAVGSVAAKLGKQPPEVPFSLTETTIGQVADLLENAPAMDSIPGLDQGIRSWVRAFEPDWVPFSATDAAPLAWSVHAPDGHWLHGHAATQGETSAALAAVLTYEDATEVAALLKRVCDLQPERLLLIHDGHAGAAGVARSVAMELPRCSVTVVEVRDVNQELNPSALIANGVCRYLELRTTSDGWLERAIIRRRRLGSGAPEYLSSSDICLVTGGIQGIAAYAARALASRTGCALVFLGRTPACDADVAAAIRELSSAVNARYMSCDVTDKIAVERIVAEIRRSGTIRGLLHGAGVNEPRRLADIDSTTLARTLCPKVSGVNLILDCVGADLNLVVGFGSIIGRQGLAGQAEYCIANDWLRIELERWAATNPCCRTQHIEWSVWSGLGMGVRMNVLDNLRQQGVEPIEPSAAVTAMFDVLNDPDAPVSVLVSSRFPASPTLTMPRITDSWLRFVERPKVDIAGVELIAESDLSFGSDPYLADHCVDGTPLLPAVLGMEAMAQAVAFMESTGPRWSMSDVQFRSPVRVDRRDGITMRIAALQTNDYAEVALRDDSDRFATERFVAHITRDAGPVRWVDPAGLPPEPTKTRPAHPFYDNLLFHGPRFHRLIDYETLSAFRARAWIRADDSAAWFSEFYGQDLMLGDPGAHDATLHVLLGCLPHRRAIPIGVERMNLWHKPNGILHVNAREIEHSTESFVFDVELADEDGIIAAEWLGLQLRALGPICWTDGMPQRLVGPWLSRRLIECNLADDVELVVTDGGRPCPGAAIDGFRFDGGRAWRGGSADNLVLAFAERPVAVECVFVDDIVLPFIMESLDSSDRDTADALAEQTGEDLACSTARIWTARTALAKAGREHSGPLRLDLVTEDALEVLLAGRMQLATSRVQVSESERPWVIAIATDR